MGVVLSVSRQRAFLRDGEWRCADPQLERRLNQVTENWIVASGGPGLSSPDPEMEVALEISRRVGGRVLMQSPANARRSARVYFSRRQYKLFR